ncbi:MAG: molybdenum cofactor carrier [Nitrospiraceae bacterium]
MNTAIVSGGQTGVDRAALDVAEELGMPRSGWCPKGRLAEDGTIPDCYPLMETSSTDYSLRTEWNVRDSDGTLVLTKGTPTDGTAYTIEVATSLRKPCLVLDLAEQPSPSVVREWMVAHKIRVLNIAGPRESKFPGIYTQAKQFLRAALLPLLSKQSTEN